MAYDEELADRVRAELGPLEGLTERPMFGGLAFLINGNMAVCVSNKGGIMVRVPPNETEKLIRTTTASEMEMNGGPARGWVRVGTNDVRTTRQLRPWVRRGVGYASDLPRKKPKRAGAAGTESRSTPSDGVRAARSEQWDQLVEARARLTPTPLTRPQRERAAQDLVRVLHDLGAVNPALAWNEWAADHYDATLASIGSADLDDVVRVITTMVRRDDVADGALDTVLANGTFTRAVDRLIGLRPPA